MQIYLSLSDAIFVFTSPKLLSLVSLIVLCSYWGSLSLTGMLHAVHVCRVHFKLTRNPYRDNAIDLYLMVSPILGESIPIS